MVPFKPGQLPQLQEHLYVWNVLSIHGPLIEKIKKLKTGGGDFLIEARCS
jgi:hypothetical protein